MKVIKQVSSIVGHRIQFCSPRTRALKNYNHRLYAWLSIAENVSYLPYYLVSPWNNFPLTEITWLNVVLVNLNCLTHINMMSHIIFVFIFGDACQNHNANQVGMSRNHCKDIENSSWNKKRHVARPQKQVEIVQRPFCFTSLQL